MKAFLAAMLITLGTICIVLFSTLDIAKAETAEPHILATHDDWEVMLFEQNGMMRCAAYVDTPLGEAFALLLFENGDVHMRLLTPWADDSNVYVDMIITTGPESWVFSNTDWRGQYMIYDLSQDRVEDVAEFFHDLADGLTAGVIVEQRPIMVFSLKGSRAAIDDLFQCYERIAPSF